MSYGEIKIDTITFTAGGVDTSIAVSGLVQNPTFTGNITTTGTISGDIIRGNTISGVVITGDTGNFTSGVFSTGTAAAPTIIFDGDPDTGFFSASTSGTTSQHVSYALSGVERLRLTTRFTGQSRIQLNNFTPRYDEDILIEDLGSARVTVIANNASGAEEGGGYLGLARAGGATLNSYNSLASGNVMGKVEFLAANGVGNIYPGASIESRADRNTGNTSTPGNLAFYTTASGSTTPTQRMHINCSGLVGIGTSSPTTKLNLVSGTFRIDDGTTALDSFVSAGEAYTGAVTNHKLNFVTNNTVHATLDTSGRLGIGTTSPDVRLHSVGTNSGFPVTSGTTQTYCSLRLGGSNSTGIIDFGISGTANWLQSTDRTDLSQTYSLLLNPNGGNVGIGTSSVDAKFHVAGDSSDGTQARITGATNQNYQLRWGFDTTNLVGRIQSIHAGTAYKALALNPDGGNVGIGTTSPGFPFQVKSTTNAHVAIWDNGGIPQVLGVNDAGGSAQLRLAGQILSFTGSGGAGSEHMRLDASGHLGIGTTSPSYALDVQGSQGVGLQIFENSSGNNRRLRITQESSGVTYDATYSLNGNTHRWLIGGGETMRLDANGRLLVGTSSSINNVYVGGASYESPFQVIGNAAGYGNGLTSLNYSAGGYAATLTLGSSKNATVGANGAVASGDDLGIINFVGNDGTNFRTGAYIIATADGTTGTADLPTRLAFWTTPDGTAAPLERLRIKSSGDIGIGNSVATPGSYVNTGSSFGADGYIIASRQDANIIYVNRKGSDGQLIEFAQDGVPEGTISVSGTTVSYNGAHLSRWSQLPSGAERTEILRGSVLSNIDEMCEWGDEENEQLNRMKVSDVEGDKNVSGVFQAWDDDDDTYTNDFYCAMTGDFVIRIGAGVTVERGDLLMSAGDGTAKPQDDDIIRSKTIAKVTSTNVSCTYDDGSYCVPCVLMAC